MAIFRRAQPSAIRNPQSAIRNPLSAIRTPKPNPSYLTSSMTFLRLLHLTLLVALSAVAAGAADTDAAYVLRPKDTIHLEVYQEAELSVEVCILKTGEASFPLIGAVPIAGLSVGAATEMIRARYLKGYLNDPKITLSVKEYAAEFVSVIGSVKSPGQIPMPSAGHIDLASALASAGGIGPEADENGIRLVRASGTTASFTMAAIAGAAGTTQLAPGDRDIVNKSPFMDKKVSVLGHVLKPGPIAFPPSGKLDLVNAIALAGGITGLANPKKIMINRKGTTTTVDFNEISQHGDRPFLLQPDDVITVSKRLF
jgi:polysaccharide export outer membrane protein